jgi:hypothetical protein
MSSQTFFGALDVVRFVYTYLLICSTDRDFYFAFGLKKFCILIIVFNQVMNKPEFVPKMPNQSDLELVFDTTVQDVQPYLFKV